MGKFDSALASLRFTKLNCLSPGCLQADPCVHCKNRNAAIAVLEAAEKVDKAKCLEHIEFLYPTNAAEQIHALIEAIPEEEQDG